MHIQLNHFVVQQKLTQQCKSTVHQLKKEKWCYGFSYSHVWVWESDHRKAEHWRIDAFELRCWRRLLKVPWTSRRSNQSILKEISPGCSLEGLMLQQKLQNFGHKDSLEKTLMLGKTEGRRRDDRGWDGWMASPTQWTWVWASSGRRWRAGKPGERQAMGSGSDWTSVWPSQPLDLPPGGRLRRAEEDVPRGPWWGRAPLAAPEKEQSSKEPQQWV